MGWRSDPTSLRGSPRPKRTTRRCPTHPRCRPRLLPTHNVGGLCTLAAGISAWTVRRSRCLGEQLTVSRPKASLAVSLSPFDRVIAHHAKAEEIDWRLIAALIFEESRFDPSSRSDKGAYGLMQVRPIAAEAVAQTNSKRRTTTSRPACTTSDNSTRCSAAPRGDPGSVSSWLPTTWAGPCPRRADARAPVWLQPGSLGRCHGAHAAAPRGAAIYAHLPNGFAKGRDTVAYVERILERYQRYKAEAAASPLDDDALSSSQGSGANG